MEVRSNLELTAWLDGNPTPPEVTLQPKSVTDLDTISSPDVKEEALALLLQHLSMHRAFVSFVFVGACTNRTESIEASAPETPAIVLDIYQFDTEFQHVSHLQDPKVLSELADRRTSSQCIFVWSA